MSDRTKTNTALAISKGLKSTLERYPNIDIVYFDNEGHHFFTSYTTKTVRVKDERTGSTRRVEEPCERHVNGKPIVKTLSRNEILKQENN